MISPEKERIPFLKPVDVNEGEKKGNVERWLLEIEGMMRDTLKEIMTKSLLDKKKRVEWVLNWPAQIILAVNMVRWTQNAENAFASLQTEPTSMLEYLQQLQEELREIVELVRGDLNSLQRVLLGALVTIDVHNKDIIEDLQQRKVTNVNDFSWISQLRYYYENIGKKAAQGQIVKIRIINAEQNYGYEYLGNSSRLVITPLTDRCYRTLMNAYHLFYGGAPEGPAGTGKTESVKDLGKAIAMQCVVFNCSDGLNYRAMSKFFKGLASGGAWCCFDEFNRIDLEVLSVIAQQVITIQTAIKEKRKQFFFDDEEIGLISTCCINITMNPGYAGRSELPDNLKALFRSCAMMVPDYSLISEIFLYSAGFQEARTLAKKVVASLRLSSEQLSSQYHYDFGMRAVKAILTAAGDLKRKMANYAEDIICLRALLDVNLPKFTINDIPLFNSITSDLFPGTEVKERAYGSLMKNLEESCVEQNLQPGQKFISKCIQLFDTIMVRHGLMLVGEAFSGKTKVMEILAKAMGKSKGESEMQNVVLYKINPKSITLFQLYGLFDQDTKSWSDGVLPIIMRECAEAVNNPDRRWIVFDGPVDAVWIENMNTVLDDNKKLCLTTGEIIKLTDQMTMMFEVEDLIYASPATVSRCGMVYLEAKNLGWQVLLQSYLQEKLPPALSKESEFIFERMKILVDYCSSYLTKHGKFPMQISEMQMCATFLKIYHTFMQEYTETEGEQQSVKVPKDIQDILQNYILFSAVWSFGGCLEEGCRKQFNAFISDYIGGKDVVAQYKLDGLSEDYEKKQLAIQTNDQDIFEICFDKNRKLWVNWIQLIPPFKIQKELLYHELIIPTSDSVRNNFFLNLSITSALHFLITGPTGTGKTVNIISELSLNYFNQTYANLCTSLSGQTTANQLQKTIESKVNTKRKKGCFGPEDQKAWIVIFIDDINMPIKEQYGAQPPIELLRQWMDTSGWYDLESKEAKTLQNIVFIAAMGPPSQGRNTITQRYSRHFNVMYAVPFSETSMIKIFSNVLEWYFLNLLKPPSKTITKLKDNLVASTIKLYQTIKTSKELLPTPAKSHYIYNLRDISKVFQGISKTNHHSCKDDSDFLRLWIHECSRVFSDRLINLIDRDFFISILEDIVLKTFRRDWKTLIINNPLLFCTFVPTIYPDGDTSKRPLSDIYCELSDFQKLKKCSEEALENYNITHSSNRMNLVLFMNALEHVIKIHRIITTAFGHALLVGVGGSGRKSMATLACHLADFEQIQINPKEWVDELQKVMKLAGLENRPTVFIYSDTQVLNESMLEDVCNILNNGEVPNLFPPDEKQKIIDEISQEMANNPALSGLITPNQKFSYFIQQCKQNLHMVICMSPVGEAFRKRIRTFPGLVNCTTIDWFLPWPEEALISTARQNIQQIKQLSNETMEGLVKTCVDMQLTIQGLSRQYLEELRRYFYVTPTSYLELLQTFQALYYQREKEIEKQITRYEIGLEKLKESEIMVAQMQVEVKELQPKLEIKSKENLILLKNLKVKQKDADLKKEQCQKEEVECTKQREEATALKNDCQSQLDKVLPILENAKQDLEKVTKNHITFIKSLVSPPDALKLLMEGVCYVLCIDDNVKFQPKAPGSLEKIKDFWDYSKKFVLNLKLKDQMKGYNEEAIRAIPKNKIERIKQLVEDPNFSDAQMSKVSEATKYMASWVRSVSLTYEALLVVDPKRKELAAAEASLQESERLLQEKKNQLQEVLDIITQLENEYNIAKQEKETLEANLRRCEKQLNRAQKLLEGLGSQKQNWQKYSQNYKVEAQSVVGDVMLSSGIIAYMGAFPIDYRKNCITKWQNLLQNLGILVSKDYSLKNTLCDPITRGIWVNQHKLPNDDFSLDNAIIMQRSKRWPLMIDPQMQANIWIKEREKQAQPPLMIMKPTNSATSMANKLEQAVIYGQPVLLENIGETIDPLFEPILNKCLNKKGASYTIQLADNKVIDYNEDFQFYLTTKLSNPHYTPEICIKVTLLNFLVTQEGLTDQMLNNVMKKEESDKWEISQRNIKELYENKAKQKKTEDLILKLLNESKGEILDDDELIDTLQASQTESVEIVDKLEKLQRDQNKFDMTKNMYLGLAKRCANLFFVLMDLAKIEPMYQFSLESFVQVFYLAIDQTAPAKAAIKIDNIKNKFTLVLYRYVVRSLLEKDKLIFSLLLCMKILEMERQMITQQEIRFLMIGGTAIDAPEPNPSSGWLSDKQWGNIIQMSEQIGAFEGFAQDFRKNIEQWEKVYNSNSPHLPAETAWPSPWDATLNIFHRLLVIRILRPDKLITAVQDLISKEMDQAYIEIPPFDLSQAFSDSNYLTPIIFILSPGADPRQELQNLAERMSFKANLLDRSLGQGQGQAAEEDIRLALREGKWVFLQNCHLAPSWMSDLERIYESIPEVPNQDKENPVNREFRLWLTSMPSPIFPVSILQKGIKLTYEPPKGLKNNLMRCYYGFDNKRFEDSERPAEWKKLLFSLSFFHALVIERRKFGPLGWNIPYGFSQTDLAISISQLRMFLNEQETIPWTALNYMVAEANYGGRVTDDKDRRLIKTILLTFYTEEVLSDDYKFSSSGIYFAPPEGNLESYKEYIMSLPLNDNPEVFGMHENAEISGAILDTAAMTSVILSLLPRSVGGEGSKPEDIIKAKCKEILNQLPQLFEIDDITKKYPVEYTNSMNTVLQQELIRFNRLLKVILSSLNNLQKAIDGLVPMSNDLDEVFNKMFDNQIPALWQKFSYPSLKPLGSYIKDFLDRLNFMQKWIDNGAPANFWISGFYFTQSFLTGTLQNFARKYKIPIDTLQFQFMMIPKEQAEVDLTKAPDDGCYVYGLYLDSARWDPIKNILAEPLPKQLYCEMPYIWLLPTEQSKISEEEVAKKYDCPVYKTSERRGVLSTTGHSTNFVLNILLTLESGQQPTHWIKRGVAMITQLDD